MKIIYKYISASTLALALHFRKSPSSLTKGFEFATLRDLFIAPIWNNVAWQSIHFFKGGGGVKMTICKNFLCNLQNFWEKKQQKKVFHSVSFALLLPYTEQMIWCHLEILGDCGELSICQKNLVVSKKELELKSLYFWHNSFENDNLLSYKFSSIIQV